MNKPFQLSNRITILVKDPGLNAPEQSDRTDKWRDVDKHVVGRTEEKTDEQRDIKTNTNKADIQTTFTVMLYYNERVLAALKRYTSIVQAGHFN